MKSWYLLPAFVLGGLAGWMGRSTEADPAAASPAGVTHAAERPTSLRANEAPARASFPADVPPQERAKAFQAWIAGMNAGNWRSYLDQAVSPEAMDRRFLQSDSVESRLFLRRLGEIAPQDTMKFLADRKLDDCIPDVAEGWAQVAPAEAFGKAMSWGNPYGGYKAIGKMAAALLVEDPKAVLEDPRFELQEDVAKELYRHLGIRKVSELLDSRWDLKSGGDAGFRAHEFKRWSGVVSYSIYQSDLDDAAKRKEMIDWYERLANRPDLNPQIREFVDFQLNYQRRRKAEN